MPSISNNENETAEISSDCEMESRSKKSPEKSIYATVPIKYALFIFTLSGIAAENSIFSGVRIDESAKSMSSCLSVL